MASIKQDGLGSSAIRRNPSLMNCSTCASPDMSRHAPDATVIVRQSLHISIYLAGSRWCFLSF